MVTIRQRKAASKISENIRNGGKKSMGQILREAGYSESVAQHPDRVTNTYGWRELMNNIFPDILLAKAHRDLLEAKKIIIDRKTKKVIGEQMNWPIIVKALDLAYKVKGYYSNKIQKVDVEISPWDTFSISDDTLKRITGNN